jgi:hypothetical protein
MASDLMLPAPVHRHRETAFGVDAQSERRVTIIAVASALLVLIAVLWASTSSNEAISASVVMGGLLCSVTAAAVVWAYRKDPDPLIVRVTILAAFIKIVIAPVVRAATTESLYGGLADGRYYFLEGSLVARAYRSGQFSLGAVEGLQQRSMSNNLVRVSGWVIAAVGESQSAFFIVFSWMSFVGLLCFVLAFRTALGEWHRRRYAFLIYFLPSLLYWPSNAGKEAWMLLWLGVAALAMAHATKGTLRLVANIGVFALAVLAMGWVRPHVAAIMLVAAAVALVHQAFLRRSARSWLIVAATVAAAVPAGLFFVRQFGQIFASTQSLDEALAATRLRTNSGGSTFAASPVTSPLDFPMATVTVLIRPFIFEAANLAMRVAAVETMMIAPLFMLAAFSIRSVARLLRSNTYFAFCMTFVVAFVIAFSNVSNFGILARQRSMVWPFVLVLLGVMRIPGIGSRSRASAAVPVAEHSELRSRPTLGMVSVTPRDGTSPSEEL